MNNQLSTWQQQMESSVVSTMKSISTLANNFQALTKEVKDIREDLDNRIYLSHAHQNILSKAVKEKVRYLLEQKNLNYKDYSKKIFSAIWTSLKDKYSVAVYADIPDREFDNALEFIRTWYDEGLFERLKNIAA